jgi:general stress protein CsbA
MNNKVPIRSWEITLGSNQLILAVSTWLLLFSNWPFWRAVWQGVGGLQDGNIIFVLSLPWFVLIWLYVLLSVMAWGRLIKPVLAIVLLVAAATSYFMNSYGIVIDYSMLTNDADGQVRGHGPAELGTTAVDAGLWCYTGVDYYPSPFDPTIVVPRTCSSIDGCGGSAHLLGGHRIYALSILCIADA